VFIAAYAVLTSPRVRGEVGGQSPPGEGCFHLRHANEIKTRRARSLRTAATDAEQALWFRLRSRRLNGYKFVRQEPIGPFIVDLVCRERRLVIEVDGGQHADNDVLGNTAGVLEMIATALTETPPHPDR